ncbi:MAG: CPBP family intramembrane metalloprotease [Spirochaetes bacterium]|nr:CPBP family intramembrane metalloprotease [Spirochaetota bacterium]MBU1081246.1 CPBP family intramembrane metalloprotease [Spirochaetota bacterium]
MSDLSTGAGRRGVDWPGIVRFLVLAFGLSWLADLAVFLGGGLKNPVFGLIMQFRMMTPAFSAIALGFFFDEDSAIHRGRLRGAPRSFVVYFMALTALQAAGAIFAGANPSIAPAISQALMALGMIGLVALVVSNLRKAGRERFRGAGLAGGRWQVWVLYGLGIVAFYALQALLNLVTGLGTRVDLEAALPPGAMGSMPGPAFLALGAFNAIGLGPLLGLVITFGEEYGWRGYLQGELVRMGRRRGVLLLGVIWGAWHWPVIWMGYNYPGHPVLGSLAMTAVSVIMSFVLAHAVFKAKGIWVAAYLHALGNQTLSFIVILLMKPADSLTSFGIGLPSIALGALVVLLLIRDPVWNANDSADAGQRLVPAGDSAGDARDGRPA